MLILGLHYYLILKQKLPYIALGILFAGLYISVVVFGNHEREKRYKDEFLDNFIQHQMDATTDYEWSF